MSEKITREELNSARYEWKSVDSDSTRKRILEVNSKYVNLLTSYIDQLELEVKESELKGAEKMLRFLTDKGPLFYDDTLDENILKDFQDQQKGGEK